MKKVTYSKLQFCKTKHKVETEKYAISINLYRKITSTKTKQSNLLVLVTLRVISEHYRKTNKRKKEKRKTKKKMNKNKREMKLITPALLLFLLWIEYQSIIWSTGRHQFNNFSFSEPVNSFSSSFIFLIVFIKLLKFSCLVFATLKIQNLKISNKCLLAMSVGYCRIFLLRNSVEWSVGCL